MPRVRALDMLTGLGTKDLPADALDKSSPGKLGRLQSSMIQGIAVERIALKTDLQLDCNVIAGGITHLYELHH